MAGTLDIKVSFRGLPKHDLLSKSDPFAAVHVQDSDTAAYTYIGQSEAIQNNHDPDFEKTFSIRYARNKPDHFKIESYDADESKIPKKEIQAMRPKDLLGAVEVAVHDFVEQAGKTKDGVVIYALTGDKTTKDSCVHIKLIRHNPPPPVAGWSAHPVAAPLPAHAAQAPSKQTAPRNPHGQLEFKISFRDLPRMDVLSKSDPFAAVHVQDVDTGVFVYCGQTETIGNNHNPDFAKVFNVKFRDGMNDTLKIEGFDTDDNNIQTDHELHERDLLGRCEVAAQDLIGQAGRAKDGVVTYPLTGGKATQKSCVRIQLIRHNLSTATAHAAPAHAAPAHAAAPAPSQSRAPPNQHDIGKMEFKISFRGLPRADLLSKSDPFAAVHVQDVDTGFFVYCGQTNAIANTHEPDFDKVFQVTFKVGKNDMMKIEGFDTDETVKQAEHVMREKDLLGKCEVSAQEFVDQANKAKIGVVIYPLTGGRANPETSAHLKLLRISYHTPHEPPKPAVFQQHHDPPKPKPSQPVAHEPPVNLGKQFVRFTCMGVFRVDPKKSPKPMIEFSMEEGAGKFKVLGLSRPTEVTGRDDTVEFEKVFEIPATNGRDDRKLRVRLLECGHLKEGGKSTDDDLIGLTMFGMAKLVSEAKKIRSHEVEYELQTPSRNKNGGTSLLIAALLDERQAQAATQEKSNSHQASDSVQLWLRCRDLVFPERSSHCCPVVGVYVEDASSGKFKYLGQTEKVSNRHNPKYGKGFRLAYTAHVDKRVQFIIYDVNDDGHGEYQPRREDEVASAIISLNKLVSKKTGARNFCDYPLNGIHLPSDQTSVVRVAVGGEHDSCPWTADTYDDNASPRLSSFPKAKGGGGEGKVFKREHRLQIRCQDLPRANRAGVGDPCAMLFERRSHKGIYKFMGHTERIKNTDCPGFFANFMLREYADEETVLKWVVFDVEDAVQFNKWVVALTKQTTLGESNGAHTAQEEPWRSVTEGTHIVGMCEMELNQFCQKVRTSEDAEVEYPITDNLGEQVNRARAVLIVRELPVNRQFTLKTKVRISLSCSDLPKMDRFSRSDPLIAVFTKSLETGRWDFIGQTERIINNHFPEFKREFVVDEILETDQQMKFVCYDIDDVNNMTLDVDYSEIKTNKCAQDIMGVVEIGLSQFLKRARQTADGKVDYPILNQDGAQVNDFKALLTVKIEEYAPSNIRSDLKGDFDGSAIRDWRSGTHDNLGTTQRTAFKNTGPFVVEKNSSPANLAASTGPVNADPPSSEPKVWIKWRNERPIQVIYRPNTLIDDFEVSLLKELRNRYGPRIYSIAIQRIPNRKPTNNFKPLPEVCPTNMPIEAATRGVTFENPLIVVSKGEEGTIAEIDGISMVKSHESYLASQEKMRRETFKNNIVWTLLWNKKYKLRITIPETFVFCNGRFACRMFSSNNNNEIVKVRAQSTNLHKLRTRLVNLARGDPLNSTSLAAIASHGDSRISAVPVEALPRVLREMVVEPTDVLTANLDEPRIAQWMLVRQFFAPVQNLRFVCEYKALDLRNQHTKSFDVAPKAWTPNGNNARTPRARGNEPTTPKDEYELITTVHTFRSRFRANRIDLDGNYDQLAQNDATLSEDENEDEFGNRLQTDVELTTHAKDRGQNVVPDVNKPVPDVIVREVRRCTLAIVDYLLDVQGLDVTHIKCEFIQRFDKKLVLHDVYEIEFRDDIIFDNVLDDMLEHDMPMTGNGGLSGDQSFGNGDNDDDHFAPRGAMSQTVPGRPKTPKQGNSGKHFASRFNATQRQHIDSKTPDDDVFAPDRTFVSQKEADERRHRGEKCDPNAPLQSDVKVDWKRAAKQAHREVLALNNEMLVKERQWQAARTQLLKRLEAREAKANHADRTESKMKGQNMNLEILVNDLRMENSQQGEEMTRLENVVAQLRDDLKGADMRVSRMRNDTMKDTQLIEELERDRQGQRGAIGELIEGARDGGDELSAMRKVRDQLLSKLALEEEKTAQFAQLLDLTKEFTPKYFETVRILLDEAKGSYNTDASNVSIIDKHVFDAGWGRMKHKIARAYRQSVKGLKRDDGAARPRARSGSAGPAGTAGPQRSQSAKTAQRRVPQRRTAPESSNQEATLMRHFMPDEEDEEIPPAKTVKGYFAEKNVAKWAGGVARKH